MRLAAVDRQTDPLDEVVELQAELLPDGPGLLDGVRDVLGFRRTDRDRSSGESGAVVPLAFRPGDEASL